MSPAVVIAVLTYRRVDDLPQLLPVLAKHATSVERDVEVLVVDNDADGSAREVVEETRERLVAAGSDTRIRYVVEPQAGIAAARNRVLDEVRGSDLLVFIDDDERPEEGWLTRLLECHEREGAAAVAGAVVPDVGRITDPWISEGQFFVRPRHPSGRRLPAASTANLLVDLRRLEALGGIRFDLAFGLTGGSDTLFTREIVARGGEIVWCDEAVVVDHIRSARLTREWVLQRHFRAGNVWSRVAVQIAHAGPVRLVVRVRMTALGAGRILAGGLRTALGRVAGSYRHRARGSRTVARGVGMVSGAWGLRYVEYRRVPGS